eukprot:CAMPEP_0117082214 /NCGR_PEP_ID=MMETSP0472-20121206/57906_1 /TAXON_ID=693140 ORGANISM="Tiarina fusus, Strain LIS" /NCGR_SAMPLE_ID=MMETSP0472 /ASSEMBLY_ACC=CAM_ASM_000603 /LENGTH=104 /DNA_ID=CAMNT_0004810383 /DNA_START=115 /DNA_END=429 /DNA_ORIENTATION=+
MNASSSSRRSIKKSRAAKRNSIQSLRDSFSSVNNKSIRDLSTALDVKSELSRNGVRFADAVDTKEIAKVRKSVIDDLFYSDEDLSEFRHLAWLEECGLDPADFD